MRVPIVVVCAARIQTSVSVTHNMFPTVARGRRRDAKGGSSEGAGLSLLLLFVKTKPCAAAAVDLGPLRYSSAHALNQLLHSSDSK